MGFNPIQKSRIVLHDNKESLLASVAEKLNTLSQKYTDNQEIKTSIQLVQKSSETAEFLANLRMIITVFTSLTDLLPLVFCVYVQRNDFLGHRKRQSSRHGL